MKLKDEVRRGVEPRLLVLMVRLLVLLNFGSLARWVRGSIPPLTPHCTAGPRRTKLTKSTELGFDAPAQKIDLFAISDSAESVYCVWVLTTEPIK